MDHRQAIARAFDHEQTLIAGHHIISGFEGYVYIVNTIEPESYQVISDRNQYVQTSPHGWQPVHNTHVAHIMESREKNQNLTELVWNQYEEHSSNEYTRSVLQKVLPHIYLQSLIFPIIILDYESIIEEYRYGIALAVHDLPLIIKKVEPDRDRIILEHPARAELAPNVRESGSMVTVSHDKMVGRETKYFTSQEVMMGPYIRRAIDNMVTV